MDERETREKLIDRQLGRAGWVEKYIKKEVNSVKSDFLNKDYILFDGKAEQGVDRYIDYLLLGEDYSPLAIIEAKKFSKDPEKGRIQARTYSKDIEGQVGHKIPIFLTNGQIWKLIDQHGIERKVSGPFTQEDLKRRHELFKSWRDPSEIKISERIVDRPKNRLIVKQLTEHLAMGHQKALVQMATGTGKTRVAMALIDVLVNANMARNVLFLVDRITLANQAAEDGFKKFFTEPIRKLHEEGFSPHSRYYASTVQTMMGMYEDFSPGFFDLIVFDEAHRSIYDKQNLINEYFDSIKVGLTATPREHESRNTYRLFDCDNLEPTVEYSYDEAVMDGILVPYKAIVIGTDVLSRGIEGKTLTPELKDQLRRQEEDPEVVEFSGSQFDKVFMDDRTNELIIREFWERCYKSDDGKPCKTIFFCASQRHANRMKEVFNRLFPRFGNDVQVITSEMYRAQDEVKRFKLESEPRIALSVGMLDSGVDVPEICNLVFIKPVFSHIRFWQMLGRGTRNEVSCKHPEWLPDRGKKDFLIFDFKFEDHSNVEYHNLVRSKDRGAGEDALTKIFLNRVGLLEKPLKEDQKKIISGKIMEDVYKLNEDSFMVREKLDVVNKVKENAFSLDEYIAQLEYEIAPLIMLNQGMSPNITSFILNTERLFRYILDRDIEGIGEVRAYVLERLENVLQKDNLTEVKAKMADILKVFQEKFWEDLTFEKVEFIVRELAPLMKYYEPEGRAIVQIDKPDLILDIQTFKKEITEDTKFTRFVKENPIAQKITSGEGITSRELLLLEEQLSSLKPGITIENIQKFQKTDFIAFLHDIIGLTHKHDPKEIIEEEFDRHILQNQQYNSRQMEFLQLLKKVFADQKRIELKDFARSPLSDEHPLDLFQYEELQEIVDKCNNIRMK